MASEHKERKGLVWKIRNSLHALTAAELFQITQTITQVPELEHVTVEADEEEGCIDYICSYMQCKTLLESGQGAFTSVSFERYC